MSGGYCPVTVADITMVKIRLILHALSPGPKLFHSLLYPLQTGNKIRIL